jgi:Protein of unknown function (DUF3551)
MTSKPIIVLFLVAAALLGKTQISSAQSAYSYPWCAILPGTGGGSGGAMSCYYASWDQCRTSMFGIGGNCVESPYYHAQSTPPPGRAIVKSHRRHHDRTARLSLRERSE